MNKCDWRARDSVAPLRQSSAGWMPANIGRLSDGMGRRHSVVIRKASLMTASMRGVWALRHQTAAHYSPFERLIDFQNDHDARVIFYTHRWSVFWIKCSEHFPELWGKVKLFVPLAGPTT